VAFRRCALCSRRARAALDVIDARQAPPGFEPPDHNVVVRCSLFRARCAIRLIAYAVRSLRPTSRSCPAKARRAHPWLISIPVCAVCTTLGILPQDLDPTELADVRRRTSEALARQSVPGIAAHWVLVVVALTTASVTRSHPAAMAVAAIWMALVGIGRLIVARSLTEMRTSRPLLWGRLFQAGLVLSSATWGVAGALLLTMSNFDRESVLVIMLLAGISAAGVASLAADERLIRLHVALTLAPSFVAGALLMEGPTRLIVGFVVAVLAFAAFLWVEAKHAHASFFQGLIREKLLERQARELDAARRDSLEASRAKSEFLANMSHEIRTPMAAVMGYADLLLDPRVASTERVNHIQTIRRNGEHLLSLVNDILDISKIEAGKMQVESIATSVPQVVAEVASLMRVRATDKSLAFDIEYLGVIPETMQSDPTRLKQILLNLVSNAIKFTEAGSVRIVVRCSELESARPELRVDVADTGIGMTPEQARRVFAPFSQGDSSTTRRFGGSGLGLVISRRLANLLGGDIVVESAPMHGSVFRLTLPTGEVSGVMATRAPQTPIAGMAPASVIAGMAPASVSRHVASLPASCRVLLAEDGRDNQVLISTFLTKAGATVKVVGDGRLAVDEALRAAATTPYDVILMDMQMPVLDGYGAASELRLMGYTGPIVAITAHAMAGDRERCERAGCDDYLTKPVDRAKLVATVARLTSAALSGKIVTSTLADDDPDLQEIVRQFVRDLPDRSSALLRAAQTSDAETLKRLAHQLKGAGGSYGFPGITDAAAAVEQALAEGLDDAVLRTRVEALAGLCRRARAA
jgi:signal transduction histidine kinase/DNA-binding response OmpR family regulator